MVSYIFFVLGVYWWLNSRLFHGEFKMVCFFSFILFSMVSFGFMILYTT